jgi:hypothetical protein
MDKSATSSVSISNTYIETSVSNTNNAVRMSNLDGTIDLNIVNSHLSTDNVGSPSWARYLGVGTDTLNLKHGDVTISGFGVLDNAGGTVNNTALSSTLV